MATTEASISRQIVQDKPQVDSAIRGVFVCSLLTSIAVLIHGFHPYAEDGGIYLPGILKILHPDLYPTMTGFVTAQTRFSLFAPTIAELVRITHVGVIGCIFCVYVASIWTLLYSAWKILSLCYEQPEARYAGVVVLALCLTMPIAGTSLLLIDPYVTARSISTPFTLLAIAAALEILSEFRKCGKVRIKSIAQCVLSLLIAAAMHPLMACYGAGCILLMGCASLRSRRIRVAGFVALGFLCLTVASALYFFAPAEPGGYAQVAQSRNYWFLASWRWYEIVGLIAPMVLLGFASHRRVNEGDPAKWLAQMAVAAGVIGIVIPLIFAHESSRSYIVAMLQPLRVYLVVYLVLLLVGGAELGRWVLRHIAWRWAALAPALGGLMLFVQWQSFPHSAHLELPWVGAYSNWEEGFRWVRDNTPKDSVIGIDANYILSAGEDSQNFRAIAERSMLPDYAKDGGIAAITPELTTAWMYGERVQAGLDEESDAARRDRLEAAHIHWVILSSRAATAFPCPYQNASMKVCHIPEEQPILRAEAVRPTPTLSRRIAERRYGWHSVSGGPPSGRDVSSAGRTPGQE